MKARTPLLCLLLLACAHAQQPPPVPPAQPAPPPPVDAKQDPAQKVLDEVMQQFQKEHITFDKKAQTVTVPAIVNQARDPIEYLLIHKRGKRHEAMLITPSKPSVLNAALLMLGLEPGQNASYVEKDPPPTLEEIEKGADPIIITPPKGMPFWMTVRWQTPEGKQEQHCVEDLLLDLSTQKPITDSSWVYLGGRMAQLYKDEPEVYIADFEGNLISVCYLSPDNHLATMVHKDARDDQNWWTTNLLPPPESEVQLVFHRIEPALHVERTKRLKKEQAAIEKAAEKAAGKGGDKPGEAGK